MGIKRTMTTKKKDKHKSKYVLVAKPSKPDFSEESIDRMMGKNTKKKAKPMKKQKPHKDLHHLTMCLKFTERSIKNDGSELDEFFKGQASRLRERLRGLK